MQLTDLLQEYLAIHAKHSSKPAYCDNMSQKPQEPASTMPQGRKTLKEMRNKSYSFGKDRVAKAFTMMMQQGLELPIPKRPAETPLIGEPDYCPYHRILGHAKEDCWVFKDQIGRAHV